MVEETITLPAKAFVQDFNVDAVGMVYVLLLRSGAARAQVMVYGSGGMLKRSVEVSHEVIALSATGLLTNPPSSVAIRVRPAGGVPPFDPVGGAATFRASANAFNLNESYNQIATTLQGLGSVFQAPAFSYFNGTVHSPVYQEWNLQIQRDLGRSFALILAYNGNHGIKIPYGNTWGNAFDPESYGLPGALYPTVGAIAQGAPPNPGYGTVNEIQSGAVSNYNGATVTLRRHLSRGLTFDANFTWSHGLDDVSNGGIFPINTNTTIGTQISPFGLRQGNYGNSDYDIRHSFTGDWVYSPAHRFGSHLLNSVLAGWRCPAKSTRAAVCRSPSPTVIGAERSLIQTPPSLLIRWPLTHTVAGHPQSTHLA